MNSSHNRMVEPTLLRKRSSKINPNLLAADISDELVCEIRKLKTTLTEKETRIQELERDREDEAVCFRLKQTESQVEKLKQENWDLEISIQTLKTHLEETTGQWTRSMTEHRKTQDQLRASRDQVEVMEAQKEKMSQQFEQQRLLLVRERKELKKENAYLQQELDQTSAELRIWKSKTITRDAGVEAASSKGKQEVEALLKQSLAHAHRMIIELRASLDQEKIGRMETKKLLEESQETIEALRTREKGVRRSLVMGRRREPPLAVIEEEDSEATPPARSLYSELACQRIDKGVQTTESSIIPDAHSKVVQSGDDRPARTIRRVRKRITRSANKDSRLVQNAQRQYSYAKRALAPYMPLSSDSSCVDPSVVAAITRTMIGECMWKGTRRYVMGRNGLSQVKGHSRYFWIHPYTMTLYWSATQPGANHKESKSKRAFIQDAWAVQSENQVVSILVQTPSRYITLTALTLESHNVWLLALSYLLDRPGMTSQYSTMRSSSGRIRSQKSGNRYYSSSLDTQRTSSTTLANASLVQSLCTYDELDDDTDDSDPRTNIRQCCNGMHDVSTLSRD